MGLSWLQGFGTTLTVTYSTTEPKFNTLAGAMRVLVAPADLRLTVSRSHLPGFASTQSAPVAWKLNDFMAANHCHEKICHDWKVSQGGF
jgi:hypothetical protein